MALLNDPLTFASLDEQMAMETSYDSFPSYTLNNETKPYESQPRIRDINANQSSLSIRHASNNEAKSTQRTANSEIISNRSNGGGTPKKLPNKPALKENFEPNSEESGSLNMAQLEELNNQLKHLNELNNKNINTSQSIIDLYATKKKEVYKFVCFALIIVAGLSINKIIEDYFIDDYLVDLDTTYNNKLALRIAYPLLIIFALWTMKVYI